MPAGPGLRHFQVKAFPGGQLTFQKLLTNKTYGQPDLSTCFRSPGPESIPAMCFAIVAPRLESLSETMGGADARRLSGRPRIAAFHYILWFATQKCQYIVDIALQL